MLLRRSPCMLIHSSKMVMNSSLHLKIDDRLVEQVCRFKFLGVVVSDTLSWSDHTDMVYKKVPRSLNLLRRLSWFLPQSLLLLFLKSYILPHFDYSDVIWSGCSKSDAYRLESLLNFGCRTIFH